MSDQLNYFYSISIHHSSVVLFQWKIPVHGVTVIAEATSITMGKINYFKSVKSRLGGDSFVQIKINIYVRVSL